MPTPEQRLDDPDWLLFDPYRGCSKSQLAEIFGPPAKRLADAIDAEIVARYTKDLATAVDHAVVFGASPTLYLCSFMTWYEPERERPHYETILGYRMVVTPPSVQRALGIKVLP
jgi:hypothetical protein